MHTTSGQWKKVEDMRCRQPVEIEWLSGLCKNYLKKFEKKTPVMFVI